MISIARTFGAPLTVPAGNVARSTSIGPLPSARSPATWLAMCIPSGAPSSSSSPPPRDGTFAIGEITGNLARHVHHVRVPLERHELLDLLGAVPHNPPDVIAR